MADAAGFVSQLVPAPVYVVPGFGVVDAPERHQWLQGCGGGRDSAASRKLLAQAVVCAEYSWPPPERGSSDPGREARLRPERFVAASGSGLTCVSEAAFSHNQLSFGVMGAGRAAPAIDTGAQPWAQARRQEGAMPPKRSAAANKTKLPDVSAARRGDGARGRAKTRAGPVQV